MILRKNVAALNRSYFDTDYIFLPSRFIHTFSSMASVIVKAIVLGAAAYIIGRLYEKAGTIAVIAGFVVDLIGLSA